MKTQIAIPSPAAVREREFDEMCARTRVNGVHVFMYAFAVTHQTLADELGSAREIVTRLLRSFAERGWIELGRGRIVIRDRAALARMAAPG